MNPEQRIGTDIACVPVCLVSARLLTVRQQNIQLSRVESDRIIQLPSHRNNGLDGMTDLVSIYHLS